MGSAVDQPESEIIRLIDQLTAGDQGALAALFDRYRDRLRRMVELRMDARLRSRLDASDILSMFAEALPQPSSAALASMLLGRLTSPTQPAQRAERLLRVQEALNSLDPIDREVLALRHFEQLDRNEAAEVLGISQEAAAKRYCRALKRLKEAISILPGGWEGL
jgi:RNA polymerase sigma-70 factor, ECF subfamily